LGIGYGFSESDNLNISSNEVTSSSTSNATTFSFFPFVRGFLPVGKQLAFYVQGEFPYSDTRSEFFDDNANATAIESDEENYFIGLRPGLTFFVSKNIVLETTLGSFGYSRRNGDQGNDGGIQEVSFSSDNFNFNLNSSDLFFGLAYYF